MRFYTWHPKVVSQDSLMELSFAFPPARGRVNCLLVTPNFCPLKVLVGTRKQQDGRWQLRHEDTSMSDEGVKVPGSGLLRTVLTAEKVRLKEKMLPVSQS